MKERNLFQFVEYASTSRMEQNVSDVDEQPQTVRSKQNRVKTINGVGENHKRTNGADNPESHGEK